MTTFMRWAVIPEFPDYHVSDQGLIRQRGGMEMRPSLTVDGTPKVNLTRNGEQFTRSVARIVAEAFCHKRSDLFDTPVHLDGDKTNNIHDNLVWRPRWWALRYARQFPLPESINQGDPLVSAVVNETTGELFENCYTAGWADAVLFWDVYHSALHPQEKKTFPDGYSYRFA